ncbi:MAG: hypothetical protein A2798_00545 [Candidatus Levybacteria bacterium RIFCSPHIGHO2_01_FULL_37_17]|nr:MAG: hypothetical protein A2798_00545 [Candidatus Levybacteria bacterium RIFCSPHIGHO2_01_FULL_37_17]OGH36424.1 MAG: hypothetical protein A2959_02820 [Candidatus Levybacteria bacterium RIFCSPLOWO2_01_FULL_38_23]
MAKSKSLNPQLPKNYRRITEKGILLLVLISILSLIIFISLVSVQAYDDFQKYLVISKERQNFYEKLNFWSSILDKYPGYSDASFNISLLYFQLNQLDKARIYLEKTLSFDPNYPQAEKLEKELEKRGY